MKKTIYFLLIALTCITYSCSSDDDSSISNEISQKLMGKWYFSDPEVNGYDYNNFFSFSSNSEVAYSYSVGEEVFDYEVGTFKIEGDILTMTFPEDVELVYVQKVVFLDENTVQFVQVEGSSEEPYDGTYYRAE